MELNGFCKIQEFHTKSFLICVEFSDLCLFPRSLDIISDNAKEIQITTKSKCIISDSVQPKIDNLYWAKLQDKTNICFNFEKHEVLMIGFHFAQTLVINLKIKFRHLRRATKKSKKEKM